MWDCWLIKRVDGEDELGNDETTWWWQFIGYGIRKTITLRTVWWLGFGLYNLSRSEIAIGKCNSLWTIQEMLRELEMRRTEKKMIYWVKLLIMLINIGIHMYYCYIDDRFASSNLSGYAASGKSFFFIQHDLYLYILNL